MNVYVDSDGVIADFDSWIIRKLGKYTHDPEEVYKLLVDYRNTVFLESDVLPQGRPLLSLVKQRSNWYILTAISAADKLRPYCTDVTAEECVEIHKENKRKYYENLGVPRDKVIIVDRADDKIKYCKPGDTLFDDRSLTCKQWTAAGGVSYKVKNPHWDNRG